jgi:hypothetical protein
MSIVSSTPRLVAARAPTCAATAFTLSMATTAPAIAQTDAHQHEGHATAGAAEGGHDLADMARDGSGTAWLPDESPMYALHSMKGPWTLMFHENVFLQYLHESGERGDDQVGSINWVMGMAQRNVGPGRLGFRGMLSAEPASIAGCGYPDLLATGEVCEGHTIHDRQHPHDLFMELAVDYNAPIARDIRWQVYGGPAGEPALGPVAYPHRVSAIPNPLAPISHHWLDSTHITFGVVTGGIYGRTWKAETSVFNGRERDANQLRPCGPRLRVRPAVVLADLASGIAGVRRPPDGCRRGRRDRLPYRCRPRDGLSDLSPSAEQQRHLGDDARVGT